MSIVGAFVLPHPPLIIPAVGRGREDGISHTVAACREVGRRVETLSPTTIVISSPHSIMYRDYLHISPGAGARGSFSRYGAPDASYQATYNQEFVQALCAAAMAAGLPAGTEGERTPELDHATMIALHFIEGAYREAGHPVDFRVVRMGISGLSPAHHYTMGMLVQRVASILGERVVYVASGDLSHKLLEEGPYGFAPEGPVFDRQTCAAFETGDFLSLLTVDHSLSERAAECGLRSFQMMAGALDRTAVTPELLSYEGPFGVGYGVAAFMPAGPERADETRNLLDQYEAFDEERMRATRAAEDPLVRLARLSLETYVRTEVVLAARSVPEALASELPEEASAPAGCFVSIKMDGELRGCIGTILPTKDSLAEEIVVNAISAGTHDPRFPPVREEELARLVYDVDVMERPEPVNGPGELDEKRYGVIVSTEDGRRGLLLPDLDGVDSVEEQLSIAARKGHISLERDEVRVERFEVSRHT